MDLATAQALTVGGIAAGVIGFIVRWAWTHTHARIDDSFKAVAVEREARLHGEREDRQRHDEILRMITRIDTQLGRLMSDRQSEKGTIGRVHAEIFSKLDKLNDRINGIAERREGERKGEGGRR